MKPWHYSRLLDDLFGRPFHALAWLIVLAAAAPAGAAPTLADFGHKNLEATGKRPLLVILIEDPDLPALAHDAKYFDKLFFGPRPNFVSGYFAAMSGGRFSWSRAGQGVVGPFQLKIKGRQSADYLPDLIRGAAKNGVDFSKFDTNKDGVVSAKELGICVIDNTGNGAQIDVSVDLKVPGQNVRVLLRVPSAGHVASFMTLCHTTMRLLGARELYGWDTERFNRRLTTMAMTGGPTTDDPQSYYLDPWHRMQFGWTAPQIRDMRAGGSFELTVPQVMERPGSKIPSPLILYDSLRGEKEFFILEYRNAGAGAKGNYDANVASNGLTIWHVQHGSGKKLISVPSEADPKKTVLSLFNRGAPNWLQGGTQLYAQGQIALRWMDKSDSGVRVKINGPVKGEKLSVSWSGLQRTGASIIQSSFGNLEVVAQEGNELWHWFFVPGKPWTRGSIITSKATGPGSIMQNRNGNFEVAALEGKNLVHYWAVPGKPYQRGAVITSKATGPGSILFSAVGNLEVVALEGKELVHYWCDRGKWKRGSVITNKATGPGGIAQNRANGHFEVVALEGNELVHYWTEPGKPYKRANVITKKATGPGSIVQGSAGHLEVIVPEGKNLVHYWYQQAWRKAFVVTNQTDRMGVGAICGNRNKNLEAVVIEGNQIVHYWEAPSKTWKRGPSY